MADSTTALSVLIPEVTTLARPTSGPLLAARGAIQRSESIRFAFVQAKAEGWAPERLAEEIQGPLEGALEGTSDQIRQAALYLAAEYLQMGDAMLLVSRETGRAIARITDADIWQPPDMPRESGGMAKPLPRLRPELEGFLYEYVHEHNREAQVQADLAVRTQQTAYLASEGDRRLNVASKAGRRAIEAEIQGRGTKVLEGGSGLIQQFLAHLGGDSEGIPLVLTGIAMARTRIELPDVLAVNYRFDHATSQYSSLLNEWVRELARTLGLEAHRVRTPTPVPYTDISLQTLQGATFWVVDPSCSAPFCRFPGVSVLHVPGVRPFGFCRKPAGALILGADTVRVEGREMFGRWDMMGRFNYDAHLDWDAVIALDITDIPSETPVVEVLTR